MAKAGRKPKDSMAGEKVNALVQTGLSFKQIADTLGMKSGQLARYHFLKYRKELAKVESETALQTNNQSNV